LNISYFIRQRAPVFGESRLEVRVLLNNKWQDCKHVETAVVMLREQCVTARRVYDLEVSSEGKKRKNFVWLNGRGTWRKVMNYFKMLSWYWLGGIKKGSQAPDRIRTGHFPNTSQMRFLLSSLSFIDHLVVVKNTSIHL
jgi:hypothetical protein